MKTADAQQRWEACRRLGTHCIIYDNATLFSRVLSSKARTGDRQGGARVTQVSPVAWQHLTLHGRYECRTSPEAIDIDASVRELAQIPITQDMDD